MNLISNAVAYSRPGGRVVVSATCKDKGLEFRVADSGQGIAAEDLPTSSSRFSGPIRHISTKRGTSDWDCFSSALIWTPSAADARSRAPPV